MTTPAPALLLLLLGIFVGLASLPGHAAAPPGDAPTAYDVLERHGLPRGILPEGVKSYLLTKDGTFAAYLGGYSDCVFKTGGYLLHYRRKITGRLVDDDGASPAIRQLKGVTVRVLFLWLPVAEVVRRGDDISFRVGPLTVSFPTSTFSECPRCRCGSDCAAAAAATVVADA